MQMVNQQGTTIIFFLILSINDNILPLSLKGFEWIYVSLDK